MVADPLVSQSVSVSFSIRCSMGDTPTLVIAERAVWRVPVLLTSPSRGVIGTVGSVDVDAQSGELIADETLGLRLLEDAATIREA